MKNENTAAATYKPRDVEESIDVWLFRPLAARLVTVLAKTPLTPNQVTALSGLCGLCAGLLVFLSMDHSVWWAVAGGAMAFLSVVLDCADGQLARLRGESSLAGRGMDGTIDPLLDIAVFLGFVAYLLGQGFSGWYVWPFGVAAGISMAVHANNYDLAKNAYLHNVRDPDGPGGSPLVTAEAIEAERQLYLSEGRWVMGFFLWVFVHYTHNQRQRGNTVIEQDEPVTRNAEERALFREIFLGHVRLWSLMGISTHNILLIGSALLLPFVPWLIHVAWFMILVPGNAILAYLLWTKPTLISRYQSRVAELRAQAA